MSYQFQRNAARPAAWQVYHRPPVAIRPLSGDVPEATCAAQRDIARTNGVLIGLGFSLVIGLIAVVSGAVAGAAYADEGHYR